MKHTILVVDDEIDNVEALERLFRRKYNVLKALSADEGLELIQKNKVSLIVSDQRMPQKTGVEFLKESQKTIPNAIRILLTGYTDIESVIDAINSGEVYRYITKPWDPVDLSNTIDKAIEKYELTAELKEKNQALSQALDELKTLDEAKSQFMILINHELKTPLTVILSFLDLLKETSLNPEQTKYIDRISTGSSKLKKIIDDVLLFVSAETGVIKVQRKKISAHQLISSLIEKHQSSLSAKKQGVHFAKTNQSILADQKIISDAIERLIENAIRFGTSGSQIEIEVEKNEADDVEISITNEGKSIPKKTMDKIMKPFTLDEDILKHSEGLGLGLSLTQALLKTHGTQLKLECPSGKVKASFTISNS